MDELEKFLDEGGRLLEIIEEQDARRERFVGPLENELYLLATEHFHEIRDYQLEVEKDILRKADDRCHELCNFMFKRIYDGEDDSDVDLKRLHVPPRNDEEGEKLRLAKKLENIPPEYHDIYTDSFNMGLELLREQNELVYDCFDRAKKALWVSFPEISEFTGNSILTMNGTAFERMWYFMSDLHDIMDKHDREE